MTGYWIYESYPHDKAVVHKGDCLHCRDGTDRQGTSAKKDGVWLGPYGTHREARERAARTKRRLQISCRRCAAEPAAAAA